MFNRVRSPDVKITQGVTNIMNKYQRFRANLLDILQNCKGIGNYWPLLKESMEGLCYGLTFMWGQAVLANDEATFIKRLKLKKMSAREINKLNISLRNRG